MKTPGKLRRIIEHIKANDSFYVEQALAEMDIFESEWAKIVSGADQEEQDLIARIRVLTEINILKAMKTKKIDPAIGRFILRSRHKWQEKHEADKGDIEKPIEFHINLGKDKKK